MAINLFQQVVRMKIYRRFLIQFLGRILLLAIFLVVLLSISFALFGYLSQQMESYNDLTKAGTTFIESRVTIEEQQAQFDPELKTLAEEQDAWLAVVTETGEVMNAFHAPANLQDTDIHTLLASGTATTYWIVAPFKLEDYYYVVLGTNNWQQDLIQEIKGDVDWEKQQLALPSTMVPRFQQHNGWAILVDHAGKIIDQYGNGAPDSYDTEDVIAANAKLEYQHEASYFDPASQLTLVVGKAPSPSRLETNINGTVSNSVIVFTILLLLLLLLATLWYAHKFSSPLLTFMRWMQNLRQGIYEAPIDEHTGHSVLVNRNGDIKRKYRLYQDVIATLTELTTILQKREAERVRTAKSRDEWISGISHDLKTPLASIQGYANMMESTDYTWSETEMRDFATIIGEKSDYMKELIDDLNVTYQLKNHEIPMVKERTDLNECIRRSLLQFINNPNHSDKEIRYQPETQALITAIDQRWFQRIMDNLIANALNYNPPNTIVTISTELIEQHVIVIKVNDNGVGMDQATVQHLFTRYYRGTSTTESVSGTGLGLAISKQLIELHDGSINVKSKPGEGTTIRILLPVV